MSAEIRRNISPDSKEVADLFLKAKKIFDLQIRPGDRNPDAVEEMSRNNINNLVGGLKTCGIGLPDSLELPEKTIFIPGDKDTAAIRIVRYQRTTNQLFHVEKSADKKEKILREIKGTEWLVYEPIIIEKFRETIQIIMPEPMVISQKKITPPIPQRYY